MTTIKIGKFTTVESAANGIVLRRVPNFTIGAQEFFVGVVCEDELLRVLQERKEARDNRLNAAMEVK